MQVNFYATLRDITGTKRVDFEILQGARVRDLISEVVRVYPELKTKLLNEDGQLYGHLHVLINGRDVLSFENALETELRKEDVMNIFPAMGGG